MHPPCSRSQFHPNRFLFRSSSPRGSSSSSERSAVSVGLRICAILPRLVGGADESFKPPTVLLLADDQDQLPKVSPPLLLPLANGGGVVGRELGCVRVALLKEYADNDSLRRWSSGGPRFGDGGQAVGVGAWDGGKVEGVRPGCHPCARISAAVCLRPSALLGGGSTFDKG